MRKKITEATQPTEFDQAVWLEQIKRAVKEDRIDFVGGNAVLEDKDHEKIKVELAKFIQNERNGSIFYNNLVNTCYDEVSKEKLTFISKYCTRHMDILNEINEELSGSKYELQEVSINTSFGFKEAILLAIEEEAKAILALVDLTGQERFLRFENQINKIITRKLCLTNILQTLLISK